MQAEIISFDDILDRIERKNIDNILYVDIKEKGVMPLYEVYTDTLVHYCRDDGFFVKVTKNNK